MKSTRVRPKCMSRRILFVRDVADASEGFDGQNRLWQLAHVPRAGHATERAGYVQAYVCKKCGFTELYVFDPTNIPVDGANVVELIAEDPGPYR